MNFGDRLKKTRKDKGLRQKDLAEMIGVKQTTIARYENNETFPSQNVLATIEEKLEVDKSWLIFGKKLVLGSFIDESFIKPLREIQTEDINGVLRVPRIIKEVAKQRILMKKNSKIDGSDNLNKQASLEKENLELKKKIADQHEIIQEIQTKLIDLLEKDRKEPKT
jgi:transcriptional regulator with XRE-family HTH domain